MLTSAFFLLLPPRPAQVRSGVGVHSAGLDSSERLLMERLFEARDLSVLCTTSTLAQGVNLPAHAVVILSTRMYEVRKRLCRSARRTLLFSLVVRARSWLFMASSAC